MPDGGAAPASAIFLNRSNDTLDSRLPRRRFLVLSALTAVGAACHRLITDATPATDVRDGWLREFAGYPVPNYLPPEYQLFLEQTDRPDGFPSVAAQVALVFRGPRAPKSVVPSGTRYPLLFFATKAPASRLGGTEKRNGVVYELKLGGQTTTASYFDGMWEPIPVYDAGGKRIRGKSPELQWTRQNFHDLVYRFGEFQIGIRGSRLCGVSFEELFNVAASVAVPA